MFDGKKFGTKLGMYLIKIIERSSFVWLRVIKQINKIH